MRRLFLFNSVIICLFFILLCMGCRSIHNMDIQFQELHSGTDASLRGLFVVNEKIIWASGSEGTVLRSVDGGESWNNCSISNASSNDFRSLYAWDEKRALVFGISGPDFGFLTEDAGQTWEVVYSSLTEGIFFNSVKFADAHTGLAVSDPVDGKFFILKTIDGGKHWKHIQNLPVAEEGEANFAASNTCIEFLPSGEAWIATGGKVVRVFCSKDFGESWQVNAAPLVQGNASSGIFSVCFENSRNGCIVGGTYDAPEKNSKVAGYTSDGGLHWQLSDAMPAGYRSCVQLVSGGSSDFLFAMGKTGCDYSVDGGKNWRFLSSNGYYTFRAVPGEKIGFVAGNNGRIARILFVY